MNVLSEKLALVLIEYNELPENIKKEIDSYNKEEWIRRMKGELRLFNIEMKYLYIHPSLFNNSLLTLIYGNRIDRTNEDSFDTLLYYYFGGFAIINGITITEDSMAKYISGMERYAEDNGVVNLWHIISLAKQCIKDSYEPTFGSLLSFYSLIQLLVLKDITRRSNGNFIHEECGRKLPYFYKKIELLNFPQKVFLNNDLSEKDIFEKMTLLRHKVIHGIFNEARNILGELFPIVSRDNVYMGSTEDAESSAFQDQIQNLNSLIRIELGQILHEWMISPQNLSGIKNDISFQG